MRILKKRSAGIHSVATSFAHGLHRYMQSQG